MDYRKFWLVNSLGNEYKFTDPKTRVFFNDPTGLGFKRTYNTLKVGNSELVTAQQFQMTDITGDMLFYHDSNGDKYEAYQKFIQFAKYKPLEFHYQTPNNLTSYHCEVLFTQADKSEVDEDGILHVPLIFHRLTEWLTDVDKTYVLTNDPIGDGKYYDLVYDYAYAGTDLSDSKIDNQGTDDVGFVLTIDGAVQNPQFTLSQNGEVYGVCKINGNYDYVRIDSVERSESIYLEANGSVITNPEQYQDFAIADGQAYLTWTKFKVGETQFSFTCGNIDTFSGIVTISFKTSYVTV